MRLFAKRALATLALAFALCGSTPAATLLPNGRQVFVDANGAPLASGTVSMYVPNTLTLKTTWSDPGQTTPNTNPIVLDASGSALIYGSGSYRQIVKDQFGTTIWDAQTSDGTGSNAVWGGTSAGTANAQTVTAAGFASNPGQLLEWVVGVGLSNTGASTLAVNSGTPIALKKGTASGLADLQAGDLVAGNLVVASFDGTYLDIVSSSPYVPGVIGALTNLASATTTDLGSVLSHNVNITGTTTITSFGSSASTTYPEYRVQFAAALTLTYNATSLILPTGASIVTAAGDSAVVQYLGTGNWRVLSYATASGAPLRLATAGTAGVQGNLPYYSAAGVVSLLAPGSSGQVLVTQGAGANPAWMGSLASIKGMQSFCYTASGCTTNSCTAGCTYTPSASATKAIVLVTGGGGSGGTASCGACTGNGGMGGGGGGAATAIAYVSSLASVTVTVGAGGAAASGSAVNGNAGGQSAFGTITANGGTLGTGCSVSGSSICNGVSSPQVTTSGATLSVSGGAGVSAANQDSSSMGGSSFWGNGGVNTGNNSTGTAGTVYGTGGSGAKDGGSPVSGAGAPGVVLVLEF